MTFEEFSEYAQSYNVIPVSKTVIADTLTPVSVYLRLRSSSDSSFLFESVEGGSHIGRFSFIGVSPHTLIRSYAGRTTVTATGTSSSSDESIFEILDSFTSKYRQPSIPELPRFGGGLVGFLGYDCVRSLEKLPSPPPDKVHFDDSIFGFFTSLVAFDHLKHLLILIVNVVIDPAVPLREQYDKALVALTELETRIAASNGHAQTFAVTSDGIQSEMQRPEFESLVTTAKEHIAAGDIFQVVLSQRFSAEFAGDTFSVYRALRIINPSPYLYYLNVLGLQVIGSSPEILVRVDANKAELYPIAGTRGRGATEAEDIRLEEELLGDEKERAEHVMLVDLGRNDLGRVCETGTVRVDDFMSPVRYSHVMHLASRVTGTLSPGRHCCDVLKAAFPAGTVSGAPKIRAMEIIDQLEPSRRGLYAGGVGYIDFGGRMDFCIAIRTLFAKDGIIYFQAGAGIVADSDPGREFEETLRKARVLVDALTMAKGIGA